MPTQGTDGDIYGRGKINIPPKPPNWWERRVMRFARRVSDKWWELRNR